MKERLARLLKYGGIVGYPAFYLVCLLVFATITFPYDKLKQRVVATYNAQQQASGGQQELQIDEMSGYWLSGVKVKGVRLLSAPTEPGKAPSKIQIDEATVRYGILSALVGNSDMSFDVYAFGGEAYGSYDVHGKDRSFEAKLEAIDLGQLDPVVQTLGVPLQGKLEGKVKLTMPEGKLSKANGSLSFEAKNVSVGDGKAKIGAGAMSLALPKVDVGAVQIAAEAKDGTLKLSKLSAGGKDLELQGDGRITLRDTAGDSLCDAQVRFKINDAYKNKNDLTKGLIAALDFNPKVKQSKRPDGFFAWTLRGPLGKIEFIPAGGALGVNPGMGPNAPPRP